MTIIPTFLITNDDSWVKTTRQRTRPGTRGKASGDDDDDDDEEEECDDDDDDDYSEEKRENKFAIRNRVDDRE